MIETDYPRQKAVLDYLDFHHIPYEVYNHPEGKRL